jgi:hypothetical protein
MSGTLCAACRSSIATDRAILEPGTGKIPTIAKIFLRGINLAEKLF